jgi:hypothetical protein
MGGGAQLVVGDLCDSLASKQQLTDVLAHLIQVGRI